jgi:hypothetical protein
MLVLWDVPASRSRGNIKWIDDHITASRETDKPLVLQEFNMPAKRPNGNEGPLDSNKVKELRLKYFKEVGVNYLSRGGGGIVTYHALLS